MTRLPKTWITFAGMLLTGLSAALLAVFFLGANYITVEGITVKAVLQPSATGITEFRFPPFGVINAHTHQGPIKLSLSLEQINSDSLLDQLNNLPDSRSFLQRLQKGLADAVYRFALHQFFLAFLSAFLVIWLLWRTNLKTALLHALLCVGLLSLPVAYAVGTYDVRAFSEAEYQGVLSMAPSVMEFASDSLTDLESIKQNTNKIVTNLRKLFLNADSLMVMANPDEEPKVVKVLLASDLHSNPLGIEFIKSTADHFQADFIIHAGDLTDYGSSAEAKAISELQSIGIPHLLAAGNHDSPELLSIIGSYDKFLLLDEQMLTISGLKVLGFPDSLSNNAAVQHENADKEKSFLAEEAQRIETAVKKQARPDILVVHNNILGRQLMPLANLTVSGHSHQLQVRQGENSVFVNPGTSGAAGLRGLYAEEGKAYSAVIVYIVPGSGVLALDLIEYNPASNQFALHRKMVQTFPADETASPQQ